MNDTAEIVLFLVSEEKGWLVTVVDTWPPVDKQALSWGEWICTASVSGVNASTVVERFRISIQPRRPIAISKLTNCGGLAADG